MNPNKNFIEIYDNQKLITQFIQEIIVEPKQKLRHWSEITRQTPAFKIGYIGQHLASLITGVKGSGSAARGDDLSDKTEVKSCNKIDQLDKCKNCNERVLRYENHCPNCGSENIDRRNDSKWLFSVRTEDELYQYFNLDRILLIIMDYPKFQENDFSDIRISAFEIYPKDERCSAFKKLLDNHYRNIYLPKIKSKNKANPMNLHPYSYQFYKCNPTLIFNCIVENINSFENCNIIITHYTKPNELRKQSIYMPTDLLHASEWDSLNFSILQQKSNLTLDKKQFQALTLKEKNSLVPYIDEDLRKDLPLRDIISVTQSKQYKR